MAKKVTRTPEAVLTELFETRRFCYVIPDDGYVKGEGWRPAIVFEREPGYRLIGDWPYEGKRGQKRPWFWGHEREEAENMADEMNARLGLTKLSAAKIIASSMRAHALKSLTSGSKEARRVRRA